MDLYRLRPQGRTKISNLVSTADEIATVLKVESVFIQSIPTEGCVGFYVPKKDAKAPSWYQLLSQSSSELEGKNIPLIIGSDWMGKVYVDDLTLLPHLLVAGTTNSGKSVFVRSVLAAIVHNMNNIKLVLSDTKGTEFHDFIGANQLFYGERALSPMRTVEQMDALCKETDARLAAIGGLGVRNVQEYNSKAELPMPYIILAIDELADVVDLPSEKGRARAIGSEKLDYLTRKSRAAGIHVIASTQRPSVNVVEGVIKSNFLARISFRTASGTDSRVILDEKGSENLMKQGDMLYKSPNFPGLLRLHSGYATSSDIKSVLEYSAMRLLQ